MTAGGIPRTSVNGAILTIGAQGQPIMRLAQNNRAKTGPGTRGKASQIGVGSTRTASGTSGSGFAGSGPSSTGFQMLDASIFNLDASFEQLTATQKTAWENYATKIAGEWELCANCAPSTAGKKLYRQYNFTRASLGLTPLSAPVSGTEFQARRVTSLNLDQSMILGPTSASYTMSPGSQNVTATFQFGRALGNPTFTFSSARAGIGLLPGAPEFAQIVTVVLEGIPNPTPGPNNAGVKACSATSNGAPGLRVECDLTLSLSP